MMKMYLDKQEKFMPEVMFNFKCCTEEIKPLLFKTFCTVVFYCSSLWSSCKSKSYNTVKVACNNIFRVFMGLGRQESVSKKMIAMLTDRFKVGFRKYSSGLPNELQ